MKLFPLALLAISLTASAQTTPQTNVSAVGTRPPKDAASEILLWPNGAPGAVGTTFDDQPRLWCYPANTPGIHTAVIVLPGGGYNHLVTEQEGFAEARWLNSKGISAYVLQYRLSPRYLYPAAMQDGIQAVRLVRTHAKDWSLNPEAIGVWGFSAGGHLAGYLATVQPPDEPKTSDVPAGTMAKRVSAHPDFAILSYARLTIDRNIPGTFGMESITGPNASPELIDAISPVKHVTAMSSPSLIYATEYDEKVNSLNATAFFNALQRAHVSAELHIFEQGPHGTHMGADQPKFPELAIFPTLIEHWLQLHGWMPPS